MNNSISAVKCVVIGLTVLTVLVSCRPFRSFERSGHPGAPEYSKENYWIALPWRHDVGDTVPFGCEIKENQAMAEADVFFIHPTSFLSGGTWNADFKNKKANKKSEVSILHQATAFNACARVFAPRYRQAVLKSFFKTKKGKLPLDLAYEDVKAAFEYYLKNWNNGRPIIIAGHSQGSLHAVHLLKDFFDGKELQKQLVAAYPIGIGFKGDALKNIPLSLDEKQTGCYVTWNTFAWKTKQSDYYNDVPCINPLTMKSGDDYAESAKNKGGITFKDFRVNPNTCDAIVHENILWIHKPNKRGYYRIGRSYHVCDYSLFYMNIRTNAILRTEEYLKKKK